MPLLPGVLLIEIMAQTSGFLVLGRTRLARMPLLAGVKSAKMRSVVEPGEILDVTAELVHDGSGFAMTKARITRDGKPVCDADLTLEDARISQRGVCQHDRRQGALPRSARKRYAGKPLVARKPLQRGQTRLDTAPTRPPHTDLP